MGDLKIKEYLKNVASGLYYYFNIKVCESNILSTSMRKEVIDGDTLEPIDLNFLFESQYPYLCPFIEFSVSQSDDYLWSYTNQDNVQGISKIQFDKLIWINQND